MQHALVIGGTGMLAKVTLDLVNRGYNVSVIGRNQTRMDQLMNMAEDSSKITPLFVDYRNENELKEAVRKTIRQNGRIDLAIAWIHSVAENALNIISAEISKTTVKWDLFHIVGSSSDLDQIKRKADVPKSCVYHQIQLGFMIDGTKSRWLTHDEIGAGVIKAMEKRQPVHIVGTVDPWELRP
ncbi:short-chain dehydrogenase [Oceanobacillus saliphilus]|uniref:short-chain dehydrogenase n=1 Tax=Oceanobacillus saliphilus TaxID=2925834 RepID=UPI0027D23125|nr:short-chain dehydrogenase [Oceanobacillus saliphilus]